jgi:4-hydroxy 2-oxovalerate aldolase
MEVLDCTLRDGGYVNDWFFSDEQVITLYEKLNNSGVDYMEIGFKSIKSKENLSKYGKLYFSDEEYINFLFKDFDENNKCKLAVMCQIDMTDINNFVPRSQSKISLVRVLMAYHSVKNTTDDIIDYEMLDKGVELINNLIGLGYDVAFNIGRIDKLSKEQLFHICKKVANTDIKYFYMADTYGSTDIKSTIDYVSTVKFLFYEMFNKKNIKIGFHAHNNYKNATCKAIHSFSCGATIVDGCIHGFGRGSGNASTELILLDLNVNYSHNHDIVSLFEYGQKYLKGYKNSNNIFGYDDIIYILSAYYGAHVNYAIEVIDNIKSYNYSLSFVDKIYQQITNQKKQMFYDSKLIKLIAEKLN